MRKQSFLLAATALVLSACSSTNGSGGANGSGGTTNGGKSDASIASSGGNSSGGSVTGGSSGSGGSSGGGSGSGGSAAGGSSGTGGSAGDCSNVAACGGVVVGTWTVASSCLTVTGKLDFSRLGASCPSPDVTGSLKVSGTWSAKADGSYVDNTTTTGTEQFALAAGCLNYSGTTLKCDSVSVLLMPMGFSSVTCTDATGGGCSCTAKVEQSGGFGIVSTDAAPSGSFTTSGNTITVDNANTYDYCVSGNKVTWTPKTQNPTTTGTIVFQSGGSSATGGAPGSGGKSGAGGATGSGGVAASGGASAAGGATGSGGQTSSGGSSGTGGSVSYQGPCDIYAASGTPCVAAYSTTRLLSSKHTGPLYQIRIGGSRSGTGGTLKDIGLIAGGVFADGAAQDALCGTSACSISKLYDQSGKGNDLTVAPPGCYVKDPDTESNANGRSLTISGHKVYALYMASDSSYGSHNKGGTQYDGYRNDKATGLPTGTAAQGIYEIVDGKRYNTGCCWDFGNAQRDDCSTGGAGAMDTIAFGVSFWGSGTGNGPWFMGDFEQGVWAGGSDASSIPKNYATNPSVTADYAFGIVKTDTANGTPQYAIRVGDAKSGGLTTAYDGKASATWNLQGAVVLGVGGDNSNSSYGTFFEGAITAGRPSDATDLAVLQNAQAAGYGK